MNQNRFYLGAGIASQEDRKLPIGNQQHGANLVRILSSVNYFRIGPKEVKTDSIELQRTSTTGGAPIGRLRLDRSKKIQIWLASRRDSGLENVVHRQAVEN